MALEGTFQDMSLSDLFYIFRTSTRSGRLTVRTGEQRGIIAVCRGQLVDALVVCACAHTVVKTGDDAVLEMLTWEATTRFTFQHDEATAAKLPTITMDAETLILESKRRRTNPYSNSVAPPITPDTRLRLVAAPPGNQHSVCVDIDQWRILSYIANEQSVQNLCALARTDTRQVIDQVSELLTLGLIEVAEPSPSARPDMHSALRDTRTVVKARQPARPRRIARPLLTAIIERVQEL